MACTSEPEKLQQPQIEPLRIGADRLLEEPFYSWIKGKRVGLITNHTGVDSSLQPVTELLSKDSEVQLTALFGPEHGISGESQAGSVIADGPRVFSLYGDRRAPDAQMLEEVDLLIFDIQDAGSRFYTYISTMYESMKSAAKHGKPFIVLDRPNPIGGTKVEGPILEEGHESFVGVFPIPIRHGMTVGELARLFNAESGMELELQVVPLLNWDRSDWSGTGLQWIAPSPNMPSPVTATLYPGFCLIEGTNFSEGRGTTRPFQLIGAPWLNATVLANRLNAAELPGVFFRPQRFTPMFSKHAELSCAGIQIHVIDQDVFEPVSTALRFIREALRLHPDEMEFRTRSFDRLIGNGWVREALEDGSEVESIEARWRDELEAFKARREAHLLY
jgi:uncharacterized protein YbbC (DUF1343 family)